MLFSLLLEYSTRWDTAAWRVLLHRVLKHMLAVPPLEIQEATMKPQEDQAAIVAGLLQRMDRFFPMLCEQVGAVADSFKVSTCVLNLLVLLLSASRVAG